MIIDLELNENDIVMKTNVCAFSVCLLSWHTNSMGCPGFIGKKFVFQSLKGV